MLNTTKLIFDQYIDGASRYTIYSVEMQRGENPEDLYFLCHVDGTQYIVFETDYINSLSHIAQDATALFPQISIDSLHWLIKKDHRTSLGAKTAPLDASVDAQPLRSALVLKPERSYLRYAILAVKVSSREQTQYNPTT